MDFFHEKKLKALAFLSLFLSSYKSLKRIFRLKEHTVQSLSVYIYYTTWSERIILLNWPVAVYLLSSLSIFPRNLNVIDAPWAYFIFSEDAKLSIKTL